MRNLSNCHKCDNTPVVTVDEDRIYQIACLKCRTWFGYYKSRKGAEVAWEKSQTEINGAC